MAMHQQVECWTCARDGQLCTRRGADEVAGYRRATRAFRAAGWELLPDGDPYPNKGPYGDRRWRCPSCVAGGVKSQTPDAARTRPGRVSTPRTHTRVVCDACQKPSADICGKREELPVARAQAVAIFEGQGWRCDPGGRHRAARWEGDGAWYCPACASVPHM